MYIAICDDSAPECQQTVAALERCASNSGLNLRYRAFSSAEDMLACAKTERFTHYFLDILMPGMDGITAAQEIRSFDGDAVLVFLTASNEYSYQSYRVRATDYLLKPVNDEEMAELMNRLQAQDAQSGQTVCIQSGRSLLRIPYARLSCLEVNQKKLYFYLSDGQVHRISGTMAEYEDELLSRPEFIRIHRSYIVNLDQISVLTPEGCIMFSGKDLPVSRLLYKRVRQEYMQRLFGGAEV